MAKLLSFDVLHVPVADPVMKILFLGGLLFLLLLVVVVVLLAG